MGDPGLSSDDSETPPQPPIGTTVRSGAKTSSGHSGGRVLLGIAALAAVISTAGLVGRKFVSATPEAVDQYRGMLRLALDGPGWCEQLEYDNRT